MPLFRINYNRPGPGIEKDTPPKRGIARWWEIFTRDIGALMLGNLILLLCALPTLTATMFYYSSCWLGQPWLLPLVLNLVFAVPLGPALAAMHRLTMQMCRDEPFFTWYEFKRAYRQDFKQGALAMVILAFVGDAILLNLYLVGTMEEYGLFALVMLMLGIYIWFSLLNTVFQQIAMLELKLGAIFKNSVLLVLVAGWRGFVSVIIDVAVVMLALDYSYIVGPLTIFGLFGVVIMTTDLLFWPRFRQLFIDRDTAPRRRRSARQEWDELARSAREQRPKAPPTQDEEWARRFLEEREELQDAPTPDPDAAAAAQTDAAADSAADVVTEDAVADTAADAAPTDTATDAAEENSAGADGPRA